MRVHLHCLFQGVIDEVSFFAFQVGAADIAAMAGAQISGSVTTSALYLFTGNADDATGTNHGAVNGATLTEDRFGNPNSAYAFANNADVSFTIHTPVTSGPCSFFSLLSDHTQDAVHLR